MGFKASLAGASTSGVQTTGKMGFITVALTEEKVSTADTANLACA